MWRAYIRISGKNIHLGNYDNIDFAVGARKQAERKYFGEYAFSGKENIDKILDDAYEIPAGELNEEKER